jgi:phosphoadenosine phosphosulfate reductase
MRGLSGLDLAAENARLENATPEERLAFAVERFGAKLLFTSSFGAQSAVLLHIWSEVARDLPVVFIDTGFLFAETLAYRDRLVDQLKLKVLVVRPSVARAAFVAEHGDDIQKRDPDFCCARNKIEPLEPLKRDAEAWVSGLRRDQSDTRKDVPILLASEGEPLKVHPIATMTASEIDAYHIVHDLPEHPLRMKGYRSIGCEPCTRPVLDGEDERAGRWAWSPKTECGLHARSLLKSQESASSNSKKGAA